MFIAGDIGGTKVRLAFYLEKNGLQCVHEEKYASHDFQDFPTLLRTFLKSICQPSIKNATFGIAGPIENRTCKTTNLPWIISAEEIEKELSIQHVFLINDLEANAWGLSCLKKEEFCLLNQGLEKKGNQALISAGTGLGEAGLYWDGNSHFPFPSEGGHADFAPVSEEQIDLLRYLKKKFDHVSFERVLSGKGIFHIYQFLIETKQIKAKEFSKQEEPQKFISEQGMKKECLACFKACEMFTEIYAAEAANLALKFLATGGLFIGGGIAPHFAPFFQEENRFMNAFLKKGRFNSLLKEMPVKVVMNDKTALLGAALYGKQRK